MGVPHTLHTFCTKEIEKSANRECSSKIVGCLLGISDTDRKRKHSSSTESSRESVGSSKHPCPRDLQKMQRVNNQGGRAEKVTWLRENEAQFIVLCHQEYLNGHLLTTSFSRPILNQICDKLNALVIGRYFYSADQCLTKWKNIKRAWRLLYNLKHKRGSGLGWDPDKETVIGSEDQLNSIYKEHKENRLIINRGLPHFDLCTEMFDKKIATGDYVRSSTQELTSDEDEPEDIMQSPQPPRVGPSPLGKSSSSHSTYNFTPDFTSQDSPDSSKSSGKKRSSTSAERDADIARAISTIEGYFMDKRAKNSDINSSYDTCAEIVNAMNDILITNKVMAFERFRSHSARHMFLRMNDEQRREWIRLLGP